MASIGVQRLTGGALPAAFAELPEPPQELFLHGELPLGPCVGIVGTRKPTFEASTYAFQLAQCLAARGITVVSGGALGIDTQAHLGALEAGGRTVVVGPSSFDRPYPLENGELFKRVVQAGGAHLSAYAQQVPARNAQFFARNSYLVALCHAVVMVEAPFRSGARNAALWARRLKRPLLVVPAPPWNPRGLGCIVELKLGALPLYSYRDVLECLTQRGWPIRSAKGDAAPLPLLQIAQEPTPGERLGSNACPTPFEHPVPSAHKASRTAPATATPATPPPPASVRALGVQASQVLEAVRQGARFPDEIAERAGVAHAKTVELLLSLTLARALFAHPTGAYTLAVSRERELPTPP